MRYIFSWATAAIILMLITANATATLLVERHAYEQFYIGAMDRVNALVHKRGVSYRKCAQ